MRLGAYTACLHDKTLEENASFGQVEGLRFAADNLIAAAQKAGD